MGRAINGGGKATFERSATLGRRSLAFTGSSCQLADLAVVPSAGGQLQGIAAQINAIPWECKDKWGLGRVQCPMCVRHLTRSMRQKVLA